jgi:sugar porter (SP) family MFS transporter
MKSSKNWYVFFIASVSAMGGLLFGYDWVVIGGAKPFYERYFDITHFTNLQAWAMSCALIGCVVGAVASGYISEKYGRKKPLQLAAFLFVIASIGTGLANYYHSFVFFRIIGGVGIGLASAISPLYIAEVAPSKLRGRFVSLNQMTIVIGILLAQVVNLLIANKIPDNASDEFIRLSWNGQMGWRWMFFACAVPATLFFILSFFVPESPRWLLKMGLKDKALPILSRIEKVNITDDDLAKMQLVSSSESNKVDFSSLFNLKYRLVLFIGITLAVLQQWCGINIVFNYAEEIFSAAGYGVSDTLFNIVITGSINLIFTLIAIFTVDNWGRKKLMLFGTIGLTINYILLGLTFFLGIKGILALSLVISAIAIYAMSLAPVIWVVLSEIFPTRIRGAAMALATFALWMACFSLTYSFPMLNKAMGAAGTFWLYAGVCFLGFIFILFKLPETKGKSLEEIENQLIK